MQKLLIGPVLSAAAWLAGSYYGAHAEQVVHKSPDVTYARVSQALDGMAQSGTTQFAGGKPMPYELRVERSAGQRLLVRIMFDGREGGRTEIAFAPQNGGQDTLVT